MDNLRRFPAPWVMEEDKDGFRETDASGFFICGVNGRRSVPLRKWSLVTVTIYILGRHMRQRIPRTV